MQEIKSAGEATGKFGLDDSLGNVYEHGVLFQCTPHTWTDSKKSQPSIYYWVVGLVTVIFIYPSIIQKRDQKEIHILRNNRDWISENGPPFSNFTKLCR